MWVIDENPPPLHPNDSNGKTFVDLLLKPSEEDLKIWPHRYKILWFLKMLFEKKFDIHVWRFFFFFSAALNSV